MSSPGDSQIMNYVVRMVVPLRREFGRQLDVTQFLHDRRYAREVLAEALGSQDPRLRAYAEYVQGRMHGARIATPSPLPVAAPGLAAAGGVPGVVAESVVPPSAPAVPSTDSLSEEELRARVMKKYTGGLR